MGKKVRNRNGAQARLFGKYSEKRFLDIVATELDRADLRKQKLTGKLSLGEMVYHMVDPFNLKKPARLPPSTNRKVIQTKVRNGQRTIRDLVQKLQWNEYVLPSKGKHNFFTTKQQFFDGLFTRLNGGAGGLNARGLVARLQKSQDPRDKHLANSVQAYLTEMERSRRSGTQSGARASYAKQIFYYEGLMYGPDHGVVGVFLRRKRAERLAKKMAYRAATAIEVLYDIHFRRKRFENRKSEGTQNKGSYRANPNLETRDPFLRNAHYIMKDGETEEEMITRMFEDTVINDAWGIKIVTRDPNTVMRPVAGIVGPQNLRFDGSRNIYSVSSYEAQDLYGPEEGERVNSGIYGYDLVEIDNHFSASRLSNLLQIKLRTGPELTGNGKVHFPDQIEIAIQDARSLLYDQIDPIVGHLKYESDLDFKISQLDGPIKAIYERIYTYIAGNIRTGDQGLFAEVQPRFTGKAPGAILK